MDPKNFEAILFSPNEVTPADEGQEFDFAPHVEEIEDTDHVAWKLSIKQLIGTNAILGGGFLLCLFILIGLNSQRKIEDNFIIAAIRYLKVALFVRVIMCILVALQTEEDYLRE